MNSLKSVLKQSIQLLRDSSPTPALDAEVLLAFVLNKNRAYLYAHNDEILSDASYKRFQALVQLRNDGEPIAYLLNQKEFWSLTLEVDHSTLIPRPETECLIECALQALGHRESLQILELGTGTGAIAIALAKEKPNWQILAVEKYEQTLKIAKKNVVNHTVDNVQLLPSDWFLNIPKTTFDMIISNPPYIAEDDVHLTEGDVRFEPKHALTSGQTGLDDLTHIIKTGRQFLKPQGLLILEHGYNQSEALKAIMTTLDYKGIRCFKDYAGHKRVICGRYC